MRFAAELLRDTIYDKRCYFNVPSKADISQFNLPHGESVESLLKKKRKATVGRMWNERLKG